MCKDVNTTLADEHLAQQDYDARQLQFFQEDVQPQIDTIEKAISLMVSTEEESYPDYDFTDEIRESVEQFLPPSKALKTANIKIKYLEDKINSTIMMIEEYEKNKK